MAKWKKSVQNTRVARSFVNIVRYLNIILRVKLTNPTAEENIIRIIRRGDGIIVLYLL